MRQPRQLVADFVWNGAITRRATTSVLGYDPVRFGPRLNRDRLA